VCQKIVLYKSAREALAIIFSTNWRAKRASKFFLVQIGVLCTPAKLVIQIGMLRAPANFV